MNTFSTVFDAICDTPQQATNMRLRADLMLHIEQVIIQNGWTQKQAAQKCQVTQPRINDLLQHKIEKFSLDALVNISASLGETVSFQLQPAFA